MEKIMDYDCYAPMLVGFFNIEKAHEIDFISTSDGLYLTAKKGRLVESIHDGYGNFSHYKLISLRDAIAKYDDVIDTLQNIKNVNLCAEIQTLIFELEI